MHGAGGPSDQMGGRGLLSDEQDEVRLLMHAAQARMDGAVNGIDFRGGAATC